MTVEISSSPMTRCVQTAAGVASYVKMLLKQPAVITIDERLSEKTVNDSTT